jgi:putative ABC transport system permease protein
MVTKTIGVIDIEVRSSFNLPVNQSVFDLVKQVKGVADASPRIIEDVEILNETSPNGEWVSTSLYGVNPNTDFDYLDPNTNITGERTLNTTTAVVDVALGFKIGDLISVRISTEEGYTSQIYNLTVIGLYKPSITFLTNHRIYTDITTARVIFGYSEGEADLIIIRVADLKKTNSVVDDLNSKLGVGFLISAPRKTQAETLSDSTQGLSVGMTELSMITTLIGGVLILVVQQKNVAERTREIGIMRSLGTSTAQVFWVFVSENLILGALGAVLGLVLGVTIVKIVFQNLISGLIGQLVPGSSAGPIPVGLQTLLFVAFISMLTTIGASTYPSLMACKKKVMQALLPTMTKPSRIKIHIMGIEVHRGRMPIIAVLVGATLTGFGWYSYRLFEAYQLSGQGFYVVSTMALVGVTIGVVLLLSGLIRIGGKVIERVLPLPLGCRATVFRNTQRNMSRTMALICIISMPISLIPVFSGVEASTVKGMSDVIHSFITSDITIASTRMIDSSLAKNLTEMDNNTLISYATAVLIVPGRTLVNNMSSRQTKLSTAIMVIDPQTYAKVMPIKFAKNTPADALEKLGTDGTMILTSPLAASLNVTVDDVVLTNILEWGFDPKNPFFPIPVISWKKFTIIGIADAPFLDAMQSIGLPLVASCYMSYNTFNETYGRELSMLIGKANLFYIHAKTGNIADVKSRILDMYGNYDLSILTYDDVFDLTKPTLNMVFLIFDVLQWFMFIIAAISILLVMWMAINERIPEIGMMTAVGTSKTQIITVVFGEAVLYGIFGFLASLPISFIFNRVAVGIMNAQGFSTTFILPGISALAASFILAVMTSLIGSAYPSWKAANLNVIQAIKYVE